MGQTDPCLYGCIAGIGAAAVVTFVISIFHNAKYTWDTLGAIRLTDETGKEKDVAYADPSYNPERLRKAAHIARGITIFLFLALFIIWPLRSVPLQTHKSTLHLDQNSEILLTNKEQFIRHSVPILQIILYGLGCGEFALGHLFVRKCDCLSHH